MDLLLAECDYVSILEPLHVLEWFG